MEDKAKHLERLSKLQEIFWVLWIKEQKEFYLKKILQLAEEKSNYMRNNIC